jgi:hypothetical protein
MAQNLSVFNLARPVPSFLGQLGEIQNLEIGQQNLRTGQQQQQLNAQHIEGGALDLQAKRQAIADQQKINQIMQQSVGPDGGLDETKLRQNFYGAGMANRWPEVESTITKVKEAQAKLKETIEKNTASEDERLAATFAFVDAGGNDPRVADKTLRELARTGAIAPTRIVPLLQQIQQAASPDAVRAIGAPFIASSKAQTDLANTRARTADTEAQKRLRDQQEEDKAAAKRLANFSRQLYQQGLKGKAAYTEAFQGVPAELRSNFDPPEQFDPASSPRRALEASETPDQIVMRTETAARNDVLEQQRKAAQASLDAARRDEAKHRRFIEEHTAKADPEEKKKLREYGFYRADKQREFSAKMQQYNAQKSSLAGGFDKDMNPIPPPAYEPPMEYDDWLAAKETKRPGAAPARAIPKGLVPGATVTLKNGNKVVVKTVNPDGSFTY